MMRYVLATLFVLSLGMRAEAQTHPCDQPVQTVATKGTAVGWCTGADDLQASWHLVVNGTIRGVGMLAPQGAPSATGLYYIEVAIPADFQAMTKGLYPIQVFGFNEYGEGARSDSVLWQLGGPPGKPVKPRVVGTENE